MHNFLLYHHQCYFLLGRRKININIIFCTMNLMLFQGKLNIGLNNSNLCFLGFTFSQMQVHTLPVR